jgi:hypothetical protein
MKKILFILVLTLVGCRKVEPVVITPVATTNVFNNAKNTIDNGQEIQFDLTKNGVYTLTMGDSVTNQILTRERFNGQIGINKKKIYTNTLQIKYLYLLLEDDTKTKIGKTIIIVK